MVFFIEYIIASNRSAKQGFDIVIGNPPYIAVRNGVISEADKNNYKKEYKSATGQFDLYALFIEHGLNILSKGGVLTMITESTFVNNKDFTSLRKLIIHENTLLSIVYLGEEVFESASVDVSISSIKKGQYEKSSQICICASYCDFAEKRYTRLLQSSFDSKENNYEIKVRSNLWDIELFERMKSMGVKLGEIAELPRGIEVGSNAPNIQTTGAIGYYPMLVGKDIKRYTINFANRFILFDKLNVSVYKELKIYQQPKILIQRIRNLTLKDRIVATYDEEGYTCTNTLRMLYIKEQQLEQQYPLKYILALLNSSLINYIFRTLFLNKDIYKYQLEQLPIPTATSTELQQIIALVDKILAAKKANPQADTTELEEQIDEAVYKLYDLTPDEIDIIKGSHLK